MQWVEGVVGAVHEGEHEATLRFPYCMGPLVSVERCGRLLELFMTFGIKSPKGLLLYGCGRCWGQDE